MMQRLLAWVATSGMVRLEELHQILNMNRVEQVTEANALATTLMLAAELLEEGAGGRWTRHPPGK